MKFLILFLFIIQSTIALGADVRVDANGDAYIKQVGKPNSKLLNERADGSIAGPVNISEHVSVGTKAVDAAIHISGLSATDDRAHMRFTNETSARTWRIGAGITGVTNDGFSIYDITGAASRVYIENDGALYIGPGASGTVPSTSADNLIVEDSADSGISILSDTGSSYMAFGDTENNIAGLIQFAHAIPSFRIRAIDTGSDLDLQTGGASRLNIASNGSVVFNEGGTADQDVRMESDAKSTLFFLDAGANKLGIDTASMASNFQVGVTPTGVTNGIASFGMSSGSYSDGAYKFYNGAATQNSTDQTVRIHNNYTLNGYGFEVTSGGTMASPTNNIMRITNTGTVELDVRTDANCGIGNVCSGKIADGVLTCTTTGNLDVCDPDNGRWTRVGNIVTISFKLGLDGTANTNWSAQITGLPQSPSFSDALQASGTCVIFGDTSGTTSPTGYINSASGTGNLSIGGRAIHTGGEENGSCIAQYEVP